MANTEREIELSFLCINPNLLENILHQYKPSYLIETYYTKITNNSETRYMRIFDYKTDLYIYKLTEKTGDNINNRYKTTTMINADIFNNNLEKIIGIHSKRIMYENVIIEDDSFSIFKWISPIVFKNKSIYTAEIENVTKIKSDVSYILYNTTDNKIFRGKNIHLDSSLFLRRATELIRANKE